MAAASSNAAAARRAADQPAAVPDLGKDQELHAYRNMLLIRRFEEKAGQLYGMGLIGGFCHLYIGQEAIVVGMHTFVELWSPAGWAGQSELVEREGGSIAERLAQLV